MNKFLELNEEYQKQILHKTILGSLRCTMNDHGPITDKNISSATKRVMGQVLNLIHNNIYKESRLPWCRLTAMMEYGWRWL